MVLSGLLGHVRKSIIQSSGLSILTNLYQTVEKWGNHGFPLSRE